MYRIFTKTISLAVLSICLLAGKNTTCLAQKSAMDNAGDKIKKFNAHNAFNRGEFKTALTLYKDLFNSRSGDESMAFWAGECYFNLLDYPHALEYFEKARQINANSNPDLHLEMGKTYQILGETEKAIAALEEYKQSNPGSKALKESDVDHYLSQCRTALELMAKPINVTVENLGMSVNSEFDDKRPSITADGKKMIFTSRRPRDKDSPVDTEGDGKYFEDIYISLWDSAKKMWGEPDLVPGSINTEFHDAACSISPDGKQIFVYKNDPLENRGGDILISKMSSNGRWGTPRSMGRPINTTYYEDGACLSPDGNTLYFISERKAKGAMGHCDIYMSTRTSKGGEWAEPVNLGPEINTEYDEGGVYIAADGKTLFFCSNGHNSMGSYDIFKTVNENGKWTTPVNLGYPINTIASEKSFVMTSDGKTAYITSDRKGGLGESDIYKVDLSHYPILEKDPAKAAAAAVSPGFSILKGTVISNEGAAALGAEINIYDEAGQKVANTSSHADESGDYFITLPGNKKYTVKIELQNYKPLEETFLLPASRDGNTYTQVKHFLLYKKP
jgi:Tol biopolymer transport system component